MWLKESPGVEIIVRDRFYDYMMGADAGAPQATQVADRWHLLHNLQEMLERWLATVYATLRRLPVARELHPETEKLMSRRHREVDPRFRVHL
jgi:transposase